jgi:hypothetical protein
MKLCGSASIGSARSAAHHAAAVTAVCRKPWEHVIAGTATAYLFQWIVDQEDSLVKQIEDHYASMAEQKQR